MKPSTLRRSLLRTGLSGALVATGITGRAQEPRPLRIIVPNSAGSGIDISLRSVVPQLSKALGGRALVVENLPGAGGIPATQTLVNAAPDGNTLALVSNNHAVNPAVYKKIPYDSVNDITPITVVGDTPFVLVVNPSKVPAKTAKELQAFLKAKPGAYNYASSGNGTIIHLAGAMFVEAAEVDVQHVPYKGMNAMVSDIIGGQVEMGVVAVPVAMPHLKSGALRAIGLMSQQRIASMPDLPTIAEQGFPDVVVAGWFAFIGPAKLPPAQVKMFYDAIVAAFNTPEAKEAMAKQENVIHLMPPDVSAKFIRTEIERYGKLAKRAAIKLD